MSDFRDRTLSALGWSVGGQIGRQGASFVIGIVLARLLSPEEFGLVAMVTVITGFAAVLADFGLGAALVQMDDAEERHFSSVFWVNLAAGLLLTLAFAAAAPLVAAFYETPELVWITVALSASFFLSSINVVQRTRLSKSLDFQRLSMVEVASLIVSGIAAVVLAATGYGVWALVFHAVGRIAVEAGLLWILNDWRPHRIFDRAALRELMGFSGSLMGTQALNYWARNLDDLLVGRVFGEEALGAYNKAYSVMLFPLENISRVIGRVMFPALSLVKENRALVGSVFLRSTRSISLLTFPMMLGLFVTAEPFVIGLLGPQWGAMIPILQVLCFVGLVQSVTTLTGSLYLSQGRADLQLRVGLALKVVTLAGIVIGLRWGPVGVAIGYGTATAINSYPAFRFAGALVGLRFLDLVRALLATLACAVLMAAAVWGVELLTPPGWSALLRLGVNVASGVVVYALLILLFRPLALRDVQEVIRERAGRFTRRQR